MFLTPPSLRAPGPCIENGSLAVGNAGAGVAEGGTKAGRPPVWPRRQLIDGVWFRIWTGVPWRDVPVEYGPWSRVYDLFRRWQRDGTWHRILTRLQA
ncbi:transposase [Streptomyces sviceus]|uniref:transposase n=1 Tax=Streptomyces sviceus TaxID=285530 RepID=UPI00368687C7